ncbi:MAG: P27 family phage terminase small subunit [Dehalococcoidia bacterium]
MPKLVAGEPAFPYFLGELDTALVEAQLSRLTVDHLKQQAKALRITGYSRMRRETLVGAIRAVHEGPRRRAWAYLFMTLEPLKVITPADGATLALAVEALVEYVQDSLVLAREGRYRTNNTERSGTLTKRHPAIEATRHSWHRLMAALDRFGANPAYRAKVAIAADAAKTGSNPWDALDGPAAGGGA